MYKSIQNKSLQRNESYLLITIVTLIILSYLFAIVLQINPIKKNPFDAYDTMWFRLIKDFGYFSRQSLAFSWFSIEILYFHNNPFLAILINFWLLQLNYHFLTLSIDRMKASVNIFIFILCPAFVFLMIAQYTETIFQTVAFAIQFYYLNNDLTHSILFYFIAILMRSNGFLLGIFPAHLFYSRLISGELNIFSAFIIAAALVLVTLVAFWVFLFDIDDSKNLLEKLIEYNSIQAEFWGVGFLKYYKFSNIFQIFVGFLVIIPLFYANIKKLLKLKFKIFEAYSETPFILYNLSLLMTGLLMANTQIVLRLVTSSMTTYIIYGELYNRNPRRYIAYLSFFLGFGLILWPIDSGVVFC